MKTEKEKEGKCYNRKRSVKKTQEETPPLFKPFSPHMSERMRINKNQYLSLLNKLIATRRYYGISLMEFFQYIFKKESLAWKHTKNKKILRIRRYTIKEHMTGILRRGWK